MHPETRDPAAFTRVTVALPEGPRRDRLIGLLRQSGIAVDVAESPGPGRAHIGEAEAAPKQASWEEFGELSDGLLSQPWKELRREFLDRFEEAYLRGLLRQCRGKVNETARRAGMSPRSLYDKMKRLGLAKEEYKKNSASHGRT